MGRSVTLAIVVVHLDPSAYVDGFCECFGIVLTEGRVAVYVQIAPHRISLYSELWAMSADGTGQTQLTHFNDPGYDEYKDGVRTIVSDSTWSPDGRSLAVLVAYDSPQGMRSELAIIELE